MCIPCPSLSRQGPPCAPPAVATMSRVVHVHFCSASCCPAAVQHSVEKATEMQTSSLYFPFKTGLHFPQTLRRRPAWQQIAPPWRSQGRVNNIIAAVEKCHWQLEKSKKFHTLNTEFSPEKNPKPPKKREKNPVVCCPLTKGSILWNFAGCREAASQTQLLPIPEGSTSIASSPHWCILWREGCRWEEGEKSFYTVSCVSTGVCCALTTRVPRPGLLRGPSTHFPGWGESMQCSSTLPCCYRVAHVRIRHSSLWPQAMVSMETVIGMYPDSGRDSWQQQ